MRSLIRSAALAAVCTSSLALAADPAKPAPAAQPAKQPAAPAAAEYPASCNAAAKPLFTRALDSAFNAQTETARAGFKEAIAADPKCAQAKAQLALMTPGPEGKTLIEEAMALAATLPEIEKADLQGVEALRNGDSAKAFELAKKARDLKANVVLLNVKVAMIAGDLQKFDEMLSAAKKATELDGKSGAAWNMLGYAHSNLNKVDDSVAAFKKYAEVAPNEPNAHDSLADALLRAGKVDEAGASYMKAIETSGGKFNYSWDGVATTKAAKGDWDGARVALAKRVEGAGADAFEKMLGQGMIAWTWMAQNKPADAQKVLDAMAKDATATKSDLGTFYAMTLKGYFQALAGKHADALKTFAAVEKLNTEKVPGGFKKFMDNTRILGTIEANAKTNKLPAAEKALAALEAQVKASPGDPMASDLFAYGKGIVALAKKDAKTAVSELASTSAECDFAKLLLADAQDAAGDAKAAGETRELLGKTFHRNPMSWYVQGKLQAKAAVPGKKTAEAKK